MLRAKRVESPEKVASASIPGGGIMSDKIASAPRRVKFQPANAFDELIKTASPQEEVDYRSLRRIDRDLKEAVASVRTDYSGAQISSDLAMSSLIKEAYSSYKDGYSIEEILHACYNGADLGSVPRHVAVKVASILSEELAKKVPKTAGLGINTTASLGDINPDHPLPAKFQKVALLETERAHLELTLDDLRHDRDHFGKQVESLYVR
jgi:hypothetical protein